MWAALLRREARCIPQHIFVFIGSGAILASPRGMGLLTTVGVLADVASGFYNIYCLWPTRLSWRILYQVAIAASDAFALYGAIEFFVTQDDVVHVGIRAAYLVVVLLLVVLRTAGCDGAGSRVKF